MDRREALKFGLGSLAALALPSLARASAPVPTWYTQAELRAIYKFLDGKAARETVNIRNPVDWTGGVLEAHEAVYFAIMRLTNIMHRRSMDCDSNHWMVMSPEMADRNIWHKVNNCDYSTPGRPGGEWVWKSWRKFIRAEVSPGVFRIGAMNNKWERYVDVGFPDHKLMMGMGHKDNYKKVVRFRKEGMVQYDWGEYPNFVPYLGQPTRANFAIITTVA
jgi:hypothetical protein